ncbi:flagellin [Azorhizobium caulinodans ORS 571]|uniref:Flagellin n=1 Tax=Azorhizobium caulinodans (strain ATCC 43989 / DSM 5975 / JCM 20966 / LMG 6465 / NBRC 14845 / NCIMB 13405 / ORS 571) TaxID=438753 RepID=A8I8S6_AZOC5|nr:flagellin [Azorhizobium caulinodans]BAF88697.1 flagellin [Azorhizobium caulinodans ORS 571]
MTSIITNNAASVALATLRSINDSLNTTNDRVSTGKKINSAADGAAYWNISTTLTSDNGALGAVKDAINLDMSSVKTTNTGLTQIMNSLNTIKQALVSAQSSTADRTSLQKNIANAVSDISSAASSAVVNGANWLSVDSSATGFNANKSLLANFSRASGVVTVGTTTLDTGAFAVYDAKTNGTATGTSSTIDTAVTAVATSASSGTGALTVAVGTGAGQLKGFMDTTYSISGTVNGTTVAAFTASIANIDISSLTSSDVDLAKLSSYMKIVSATIDGLQAGSTALGTTQTRLTSQQNFAQSLIDINTSSIGSLVDANMEEESTKLKALQTQQQLAVQSLSIANNSTSNIMTLFR